MGVFQDSHLPLNNYKLNIDDSKRNLVTSGMVCALFGPRQMPFHASKKLGACRCLFGALEATVTSISCSATTDVVS
jgi:hypothetical protein